MKSMPVQNIEGRDNIPFSMKFGYGTGDFAVNVAYQVCALYLIYFFTDVFMISAVSAGTIFMVSKLWDAVSDPVVGVITDHTRTKWGKKRPYLLFGAIPLSLAVFLVFAGPKLSEGYRIAYATVTFMLFSTAIAVVSVPYAALIADMTLDAKERSSISGFRGIFALLGSLFAAGATKPLVALFPNEAYGFRMVGIFYAIIISVILIITFASVRERVAHPLEEKLSIKNSLWVIKVNTPFIILATSTVLYMIAVYLLAAMVNYYFKYNLRMEKMIPFAFLALFVTAAIFIPVFVFISKARGKKFAFNLGVGLLGLMLILFYFLGDAGTTIVMLLFILGGIGFSTIYLSPWALVPDTVEYSELKTGLRREGTLFGCFFLCFKISAAVSGFIAGWGLKLSGYVPNTVQSGTALFGIKVMVTLVPLLFIIAGMTVFSFYPIDEKAHLKIIGDIGAMKESI